MKVSEIIIKIDDINLSLTPDEAKELRDILDRLFSEKETKFIPYYYPVIYPYGPVYPYWTVTASISDTEKYIITSCAACA